MTMTPTHVVIAGANHSSSRGAPQPSPVERVSPPINNEQVSGNVVGLDPPHLRRGTGNEPPPPRITVDIRGHQGDAEGWLVNVKRQEKLSTAEERFNKVENGVRNASTTINQMAGALVSVLMIGKVRVVHLHGMTYHVP